MCQHPHLNFERRHMIANCLGVKLEQVDGGTAPWNSESKITHVEKSIMSFKDMLSIIDIVMSIQYVKNGQKSGRRGAG